MVRKEQRLKQIKYVVDNSNDVKINQNKIQEYIEVLKIGNNTYWLNHESMNLSEKEIILLMFIIESMNFCFWKQPYIEINFNGEYHKRSTAMFYSVINKVINDKSFLKIDNLIKISKKDLTDIFGGRNDLPYINERYNNLSETIKIIYDKKDMFYQELFSLNSDEELLNYIVTTFPSFNDIGNYKGQLVYFYKRATLLVHDLFEVSNTIRNNISNVDNLLACADYGIPRTLRHYEIIEYSDKLASKIDNKIEIEHDSDYEIEIRANMIYALELIKEGLAKTGVQINSILLDNVIWITGRNVKGEHHLTETTFY